MFSITAQMHVFSPAIVVSLGGAESEKIDIIDRNNSSDIEDNETGSE
jgi:hypothetical protein